MSIDLRIDTISISGLPLQPADAERMRPAIVNRLTELIEAGGIDLTRSSQDRVSGDMHLSSTHPSVLANEIAGTIYDQIGERR